MTQAKKNLRDMSILVLLITGLSLIRLVIEAFLGGVFTVGVLSTIPEGMSKELATTITLVGQIVVWGIAILALIPHLFVGLRGLKNAEGPMDKLGHVTWAKVLFVFAVIASISAMIELFSSKNIVNDIITFINVALDAIIFYLYIKSANQINKA